MPTRTVGAIADDYRTATDRDTTPLRALLAELEAHRAEVASPAPAPQGEPQTPALTTPDQAELLEHLDDVIAGLKAQLAPYDRVLVSLDAAQALKAKG